MYPLKNYIIQIGIGASVIRCLQSETELGSPYYFTVVTCEPLFGLISCGQILLHLRSGLQHHGLHFLLHQH